MNSRNKGAKGERELASVLRSYGYDAHRGQQYHGGADSPDVTGLPHIHIECKRTERFHLWDALAQSKRDSGADEVPIVVHRANNCPWVVVLELEDFMTIYREWEATND